MSRDAPASPQQQCEILATLPQSCCFAVQMGCRSFANRDPPAAMMPATRASAASFVRRSATAVGSAALPMPTKRGRQTPAESRAAADLLPETRKSPHWLLEIPCPEATGVTRRCRDATSQSGIARRTRPRESRRLAHAPRFRAAFAGAPARATAAQAPDRSCRCARGSHERPRARPAIR